MLAVASRPIVVHGMRSCALPRASALQGSINPALILDQSGRQLSAHNLRPLHGTCGFPRSGSPVFHKTLGWSFRPKTMGAGARIQDRRRNRTGVDFASVRQFANALCMQLSQVALKWQLSPFRYPKWNRLGRATPICPASCSRLAINTG